MTYGPLGSSFVRISRPLTLQASHVYVAEFSFIQTLVIDETIGLDMPSMHRELVSQKILQGVQ